jgi:acyl carrier protein
MNVHNEVIRLLSNEGCGVFTREQIDLQQKLFDIGFNSLRYMEFVVLLEESLVISLPDGLLDIRVETTVADIIRMVSAYYE